MRALNLCRSSANKCDWQIRPLGRYPPKYIFLFHRFLADYFVSGQKRYSMVQAKSHYDTREADQTSRRPSIARAIVTSSAYSISLPAGTPVAMRVTRTGSTRSTEASQLAVASPSSVGLVARI